MRRADTIGALLQAWVTWSVIVAAATLIVLTATFLWLVGREALAARRGRRGGRRRVWIVTDTGERWRVR